MLSLSEEKTFNLEQAKALDQQDPLRKFRSLFSIPQKALGGDSIYFAGNSLGLQCRGSKATLLEELKKWEELGVEGHFSSKDPWFSYHENLTDHLSEIVGAAPFEVVVMNSLTANLHFLMTSFYRPTAERYKILINPHMFPSDRYALQSQINFHQFDPKKSIIELPSHDGIVKREDIYKVLQERGQEIALVWMEGVNFYSGQAFPLEVIAKEAHKQGALVGFDLAHAVGNISLELHDSGIDFAVWCSYKYLNGGPGCLGGAFVHERHHQANLKRFAGWWGHNKERRFLMEPDFLPIIGAEGWQLSNPSIFALAPLKASLELFHDATMPALVEKSKKLTSYLKTLLKEGRDKYFSIVTPDEEMGYGCQLSLRLMEKGKECYEKLKELGVVCDWREPDIIRIAPVPLYNSFSDIYHFAEIFYQTLKQKSLS